MLTRVEITWDVLWSCFVHAQVTEKQEVMSLLLGDWKTEEGLDMTDGELHNKNKTKCVAHVWGSTILTRSDKRKDRVEISPEQLANASTLAEQMSKRLGVRTRVIGWFHSHPHITVHPSHVDVRTQYLWQQMSQNFCGIIAAPFNTDSMCRGRLQMTAFQTRVLDDGRQLRADIPISVISPKVLETNQCSTSLSESQRCLLHLQKILFEEERDLYTESIRKDSQTDSGMIGQRAFSAAVFQKALVLLMEKSLIPLRNSVLALKQEKQRKLELLQREMSKLQSKKHHMND